MEVKAQTHKSDSIGFYLERPGSLLDRIISRTDRFQENMERKSEKHLKKLIKEEKKAYNRLFKKDSLAAAHIFGNIDSNYAMLQATAKMKMQDLAKFRHYYVGGLDSVVTSLNFLNNTGNFSKSELVETLYGKAKNSLTGLQDQFGQAAELQTLLESRTKFLSESLSKFGFTKELIGIRKRAYYYQQQIADYKSTLQDPDKLAVKALRLAQKLPAFNAFFQKHSQLTSLFSLPGQPGSAANISNTGLQQRAVVEKELQDRLGVTPGSHMEEQLLGDLRSNSGNPLDHIKNKANSLKSGEKGSAGEMPDFKPNSQKTKSFLKRLEYGANIQTIRSNQFFPSTSDIGLSLGYKLSDKFIIGVGSSYKMGWGKDIRNIAITHQGVGLRSFLDIKLKGSIWITGGSEWNYRQPFGSFSVLKDFPNWQQSALFGLQKKFTAGKLKSSIQLLYDCLWRQQTPHGQPILFRVGYTLK